MEYLCQTKFSSVIERWQFRLHRHGIKSEPHTQLRKVSHEPPNHPAFPQALSATTHHNPNDRPEGARKTLDELKNPVTIMQLMELADISRPTANRALKEYAEVVGTVSVQTTRGVRELKTFKRKI